MSIQRGDHEYYSIREASQIAGREPETIRRWLTNNWVKGFQDGTRRWWVQRKSLEKFLGGEDE